MVPKIKYILQNLLMTIKSYAAVMNGACPVQQNDPFTSEPAVDRRALRRLLAAIVFCTVFMVVEIVGGFFSGSLAIITDAAHLLSG